MGGSALKGRQGEAALPHLAEARQCGEVESEALCTIELRHEQDIGCRRRVSHAELPAPVADRCIEAGERVLHLGHHEPLYACLERIRISRKVAEQVAPDGAGQLEWLNKAVDALHDLPHPSGTLWVGGEERRLGPRSVEKLEDGYGLGQDQSLDLENGYLSSGVGVEEGWLKLLPSAEMNRVSGVWDPLEGEGDPNAVRAAGAPEAMKANGGHAGLQNEGRVSRTGSKPRLLELPQEGGSVQRLVENHLR